MKHIPRWKRLLDFIRGDVAADVDDELAFHLAMRAERNRALGMSADDADRDARARFGEMPSVRARLIAHDRGRERKRERREYVRDLVDDLRFGVRALRRSPRFASAAILTLALTIGANAAIFSVVDAVVLRPLPFPRPDELVLVGSGSPGEYSALRERLRSFSDVGVYVPQTHPIDAGGGAERLLGAAITHNLLPLLGVEPARGRNFTAEETAFAQNMTLILSDGYWRSRFGAGDVIGRTVQLEGATFTIVGVMPPDFAFPDRHTQYWMPYAMNPANVGMMWAVGNLRMVARIAPSVTADAAQREVAAVWPTLRRLNPLWDPGETYRRDARIEPLHGAVVGNAGALVWLLFGCVLAVLLVGCVNVANLLLARSSARERELAVRTALGGGRGRLMRQLLTESVLLSSIGAAAGIGLAWVMVNWFVAALPPGVPRTEAIGLNGITLAYTAAVAVLTGIVFGIVPAIRATGNRSASAELATATRTTRGGNHQRIASLLVATEVALAVLLAIGAGLLAQSYNELRRLDPGFTTDNVVAARVTPPAIGYNPTLVTALYSRVLERVQTLPGIRSVAAVDKLSLGGEPVWGFYPRVAGQFEDASRPLPQVGHLQSVTPDYFATIGLSVEQGRAFTAADDDKSAPVAIVSQSVARQFWPNDDAIGKRIAYPYESPWMTVVGVVPDIAQDSLRDTSRTTVYTPWQQRSRMSGTEMWLVARTSADHAALSSAIRAIVHEVDPNVAVGVVRTMDALVSSTMQKARFVTLLFACFALTAVLLGAVGIYGVMSYVVSQRTREMGIRLALGARPSSVVRLVVGQATAIAAIGVVVGLASALVATRALRGWLFGVSATDPLTFIGVPVLLLAVATVASWLPARRGTQVDPVKALRAD